MNRKSATDNNLRRNQKFSLSEIQQINQSLTKTVISILSVCHIIQTSKIIAVAHMAKGLGQEVYVVFTRYLCLK